MTRKERKKHLDREIKNITAQLVKKYQPEKIILFGSSAWGEPGQDSDLDFLVIKEGIDEIARHKRLYALRKLLPPFDTAIDFLVYSPYEIKKRLYIEDPFFEQILKKGKILYAA